MVKKIAINQSNYFPWIGYFKLIEYVDEFIFYDEAQYTRGDWRNRNIITQNGKKKWITIPLKKKNTFLKKINEMETENHEWKKHHLNKIKNFYLKEKNFSTIYDLITNIYNQIDTNNLSKINQICIKKICEYENITTKMSNSIDVEKKTKNPTDRIIEICNYKKASHYVSGKAALNYLETKKFNESNITLEWFDYNEHLSDIDNNINNLKVSVIEYLMKNT